MSGGDGEERKENRETAGAAGWGRVESRAEQSGALVEIESADLQEEGETKTERGGAARQLGGRETHRERLPWSRLLKKEEEEDRGGAGCGL